MPEVDRPTRVAVSACAETGEVGELQRVAVERGQPRHQGFRAGGQLGTQVGRAGFENHRWRGTVEFAIVPAGRSSGQSPADSDR